jgi:hypothetical protein
MYATMQSLLQGVPVSDSFETWLAHIENSNHLVKDSFVNNYRLFFHVPAGKRKDVFPKEKKLLMSAYRVNYIDTLSKYQSFTQYAVEAYMFFEKNPQGMDSVDLYKDAIGNALRSSFFSVKEHKVRNHPETVFLLKGPGGRGRFFVTKGLDKKTDKYYLMVMYRITELGW